MDEYLENFCNALHQINFESILQMDILKEKLITLKQVEKDKYDNRCEQIDEAYLNNEITVIDCTNMQMKEQWKYNRKIDFIKLTLDFIKNNSSSSSDSDNGNTEESENILLDQVVPESDHE